VLEKNSDPIDNAIYQLKIETLDKPVGVEGRESCRDHYSRCHAVESGKFNEYVII
jgi:hypothetical protein